MRETIASRMESGEESEEPDRASALRVRVIGFTIVSIVAVAILALLGASALLIIEVFGLAIILGVSAVMIILVFGRSPRIR